MPPTLHNRQTIRLKNYDYTQPGAYFVTIDTQNLSPLFGQIIEHKVQLNQFGQIARGEWLNLADRFAKLELDEFIIMPDHVHGILIFCESSRRLNVKTVQPPSLNKSGDAPIPSSPGVPGGVTGGSLGAVVGAYKSSVARLINGINHTPGVSIWHRNYYERIVRTERELDAIRRYIQDNPLNFPKSQS